MPNIFEQPPHDKCFYRVLLSRHAFLVFRCDECQSYKYISKEAFYWCLLHPVKKSFPGPQPWNHKTRSQVWNDLVTSGALSVSEIRELAKTWPIIHPINVAYPIDVPKRTFFVWLSDIILDWWWQVWDRKLRN